ncbi:MAG TPA: hypothetical protein VGQ33_22670, partial [Vicinamibacteria bacterium]|nr:hypothetical protein [Vicinamibacteria bacterium]
APDAPEISPPPPWRFWVDTPEAAIVTDVRDADAALAAVRASLTAALESYRRPLTSLRPDEFVSVAVDVVSDRFLRPATARTLMLRVRARDLQERAAGRLSAADFRQRLEFEEN